MRDGTHPPDERRRSGRRVRPSHDDQGGRNEVFAASEDLRADARRWGSGGNDAAACSNRRCQTGGTAGAGLRLECRGLRPEHADERDSGDRGFDHGPAGRQRDGLTAVRAAVQTRHVRERRESVDHPGGLLHRGRRARGIAGRCRHQRSCRRLQPVSRPGQLHRAEQLLAFGVQPDDQRQRPVRLSVIGRFLGGLAGGADAPREHHRREPDVAGLLHRGSLSTRAVASSPTPRRASSSTAHSSSSSSGTAASVAGRTVSGTRSSRVSWERRRSRSRARRSTRRRTRP